MNNLPLKIFYTLKEASAVLNERLKSTEINEDYFLHLGKYQLKSKHVFITKTL
jgi:hypothetical protein